MISIIPGEIQDGKKNIMEPMEKIKVVLFILLTVILSLSTIG